MHYSPFSLIRSAKLSFIRIIILLTTGKWHSPPAHTSSSSSCVRGILSYWGILIPAHSIVMKKNAKKWLIAREGFCDGVLGARFWGNILTMRIPPTCQLVERMLDKDLPPAGRKGGISDQKRRILLWALPDRIGVTGLRRKNMYTIRMSLLRSIRKDPPTKKKNMP